MITFEHDHRPSHTVNRVKFGDIPRMLTSHPKNVYFIPQIVLVAKQNVWVQPLYNLVIIRKGLPSTGMDPVSSVLIFIFSITEATFNLFSSFYTNKFMMDRVFTLAYTMHFLLPWLPGLQISFQSCLGLTKKYCYTRKRMLFKTASYQEVQQKF